MSKKKQNSVLAADSAANTVTAPVVSATGYAAARFDAKQGDAFRSDNWNYADDEVVLDLHGKYITFGELKQRKAEGDYDDWDAEEQKNVPKEMDEQEAKEAEEAAKRAAALAAYRGIVREAYQNYRRNLDRFPEIDMLMASGDADELFGQNDIIFQEQVKEEAARLNKNSKKLHKQVESLVKAAPKTVAL